MKLGHNGDLSDRAALVASAAAHFGSLNFKQTGAYLRFSIREQNDPEAFLAAVESVDSGIEVISLGKRLEIVKQVGSPANLDALFRSPTFRAPTVEGTRGCQRNPLWN